MKTVMDKLFLKSIMDEDRYYDMDTRHINTFYNSVKEGYIDQQIINEYKEKINLLRDNNDLTLKLEYKNKILKLFFNGKTKYFFTFLSYMSESFDCLNSLERCLYTTKRNNIFNVFEEVLYKLNSYNIKTIISEKTDFAELLKLLLDNREINNPTYYNRLLNNLKQLENLSWSEYMNKMYSQDEEDQYNRQIAEITSMDLPTDWINMFDESEAVQNITAENASDGLILSLNNLGKVDIEYISKITGLTCKEVIKQLRGSIFQNPEKWNECFYKGWETADEYLSGRVIEKLSIAIKANNKYKGYFDLNIEALRKLQFEKIEDEDIYITLGSPWIPDDIINEFINKFFIGYNFHYYNIDTTNIVRHDPTSGIWEINNKIKHDKMFANIETYGTSRKKGLELLEMALNAKSPVIYDNIQNGDKDWKVVNKEETLLAKEKQNLIIEKFKNWVWADEKRKARLTEIFKDKYCSYINRKYDGSFLKFNNMNKNIRLFDYQKNSIARIIFSSNLLLAHDVGAGKTFIMIASGMEKKRLGLSNKNMYVVPNSLVSQWEDSFKLLYPTSNILIISPKTFTTDKKNEILLKIKNNNYDAIIMAYSCFDQIPISKQYQIDQIEEEIKILNNRRIILKNKNEVILNKIEKLIKLKKALQYIKDNDLTYFDELGINSLYIDEAHNYKNFPIEIDNYNVYGINQKGSKKCIDMYNKIKIVQRDNNGGGVVLATATPITNSLTDIYVMQKYLQEGQLKLLNLESFDSWVSMFAESKDEFEIDVDTNNFRIKTRYSKFHNMKEFSNILSTITDFHQIDKNENLPHLDSYKNVIVKKTVYFKEYLDQISIRADRIRNRTVTSKDDNMLKITTDGRKAALDLRLIKHNYPFSFDSKVYNCAENVYKLYKEYEMVNATQLVFCDTSTPKKDFNMYDELKRLLIMMGIPENKIAFVHDATTDAKRQTLFNKVNKGEVRILIGSTFKLGLGVNVQKKLIAIHHLDIPWRPSDMIQREGRILRKGNENENVYIFRYITEGSFDAYSWQILETKQKMIREILSGTMNVKMCDDLNDTVLNYAEVKALAIGNPLLKERVEIINEINKNLLLQNKYKENKQKLEMELFRLPNLINNNLEKIKNITDDYNHYINRNDEKNTTEKEELINLINYSIKESVDYKNPKIIDNYYGFDIIIPNHLLINKKTVYLKRKEQYTIAIGNNENKVLNKIDDYLNELNELILENNEQLTKLKQKEIDIKNELSKDNDYIEKIEQLKQRLEENSIKLGVDNNEFFNF